VCAQSVAFYCVANSRHFLGAVGMLNSLRMLGHHEPVHLLDCGLTPGQREVLAPHVSIVAAPREAPPYLLKTIAPLGHPAEVMVLIDADLIVTRPLTELVDEARGGRVVAFRAGYDRFFPEWGELLGLGAVESRPYVCSALVVLGGDEGGEVLRLMDEGQAHVPPPTGLPSDPHRFFGTIADSPLQLADQDVLNAVLCTRPQPDRIVPLEHALAPDPPFAGVRVVDQRALKCATRDGSPPYLLHHLGAKPWLVPMRDSPYSRLLGRLLVGPGVDVRVPEGEVPVRLRSGLLAAAGRRVAGLEGRLRAARGPLSWRLAALRGRVTGDAGNPGRSG